MKTDDTRPRILLVTNARDVRTFLETILVQFPNQPEVFTAASSNRALETMAGQTFALLVVDLQMPQMQGLMVLSVARRKYPRMRIVVLTGAHEASEPEVRSEVERCWA
jgi:CheY-like chemotaxis protein